MRYIWLSKSAGEYTWTVGIIPSGHSKWWGVMKSTIPVGHREVIWSSAQNLTAITFNNARSFLVIARETHKRATLIPKHYGLMDALEHRHMHTKTSTFTVVNITQNVLTQASELLTRPPLARFSKRIQVAFMSHTGHSVSWATAPPCYCYNYNQLHCRGHLCTSSAVTVTALATGTFNTVATWTAGPC